jgi:hypothetical protein
MNIRETIEQIAGDFGCTVSIVQTINGIDTTYIEQDVYRNQEQGAWPYVFFPCNERAIDFACEHITRIVIAPAGICIYINTP